ncbi:MAG: SDR family oxidoreductase [Candidatus Macondimonas sp.]
MDSTAVSAQAPRMATVDEMADLALFLISPLAAYMTGQIIALDGGVSLLGGGMRLDG